MKYSASRRAILRNVALAAFGGLASGISSARLHASDEEYAGPLLVTLQLSGGYDPTCFCDPKINVPGEKKISHWADDANVQWAGGLPYAPFANNQWFYEKYAQQMLVINGVDSQTNSHDTGKLYNWSGRNSVGSPTLTALHAAAHAPDQPLSYTVFGGFSYTADLVRFNRFSRLQGAVREILNPAFRSWDGRLARPFREFSVAKSVVNSSVRSMQNADFDSPRVSSSLKYYEEARRSRRRLAALADTLPSQNEVAPSLPVPIPGNNITSELLPQIQGALLIFNSGLGSAVDIEFGDFDTHDNHDARQAPQLEHVAEAIDYLWTFADELGLAERLTLLIGSDFGRTNFYNDGNGKDHWPIGSYIIMEKNPDWGGRVVGLTDDLHNTLPINPITLQLDSNNGILIHPGHIHKALRRYLECYEFANTAGFELSSFEDLDIFDPMKQTAQS